jgi:hypothetical protein
MYVTPRRTPHVHPVAWTNVVKRREREKDKEKFVVLVSGLQAWSEATAKEKNRKTRRLARRRKD